MGLNSLEKTLHYQLKGFRFEAGWIAPSQDSMHQHPDIELVLFLTESSSWARWIRHESWAKSPLASNHLCLIPSHHQHSVGWHQPAQLIRIFLHPTLLFQSADEYVLGGTLELSSQYGIQDPIIHSIAMALYEAQQSENETSYLYLDSLVNMLIMHLLRTYSDANLRLECNMPIRYQRWFKDVIDYVHCHFDQNLRLKDLAAIARTSESCFRRLFQESMDMSPYEYLLQVRRHRAKELLFAGHQSTAEIAKTCGFRDVTQLRNYVSEDLA